MKPRVLVTGASRGLGFGIANRLADGCSLVLSSRLTESEFLKASGFKKPYAEYVQIDFSQAPDDFLKSITKAKNIDVLVHNASPYTEDDFFKCTSEQIVEFSDFTRNATLLMRFLDNGNYKKFVFVSSTSVDLEYPRFAGGLLYRQHKCALHAICALLQKEKPTSVLVVPGLISLETPCPDDAVAFNDVVEKVAASAESAKHDEKIIKLLPKLVTGRK